MSPLLVVLPDDADHGTPIIPSENITGDTIYTVNFDCNGVETNCPNSIEYNFTHKTWNSESISPLTKNGYDFTGFFDGNTKIFDKDGDLVEGAKVSGNVTLKANWEKHNMHTITLNKPSGCNEGGIDKIYYDPEDEKFYWAQSTEEGKVYSADNIRTKIRLGVQAVDGFTGYYLNNELKIKNTGEIIPTSVQSDEKWVAQCSNGSSVGDTGSNTPVVSDD